MKTNAIISALCVVGIAWFGAGCDKSFARADDDLMLGVEARPAIIPTQKVVYWSDIPGMKWTWASITNKPSIPTYSDVLLTPVFTEWSFSPATYSDGRVITMHEETFGDVVEYSIYANGAPSGADIQAESPTVTTISWGYPEWGGGGWGMGTELVATRTISSYRLGSQSDKLLQPASTNEFATTTWVNAHQWTWASITNKPTFATVATSGSYNDLNNKPTIPSASDFVQKSGDTMTGDLTMYEPQNGATIYFPGSAKGKLSFGSTLFEVNDDTGHVTIHGNEVATVNQLPTVPTNVSAFNNDSNYTSGQVATNIARQIIRDAVSGVNTNIQSAEDARAALTNLITILKNL